MTERGRTYAIAASIGFVVAVAALVVGFSIVGLLDDGPEPDGTFVLDEPGIFVEPSSDDGHDGHDSAGEQLPDVVLVDATGAERRLSEFRGEPLVVNLWFSTCAPCKRELVDFAEVHAEVGDEVRFVGVDPFDTVEAMERFAEERGVTYDLWRDPDFVFANALEVAVYPVTLFVSPDGQILRQTGEIDADGLRSAIAELF